MINGLSLFSGIGGIDLALAPWVRPIAYCENDRYAQSVLLARMASGDLHAAPIWDDVRTLSADFLPGVDIIFGGFPCQDLSVAGTGAGLDGERSGLVFELLRLVRECGPRFVFLENVPALAVRGLDRLLLELAALGYDARWTIVSALEVGAPHLRERIWILAYSAQQREREQTDKANAQPVGGQAWVESRNGRELLAYADRSGLEVWQQGVSGELAAAFRGSWWATEPDVGRVAYGVPARVDRLRGLGNAVVPQAAREAFKRLMGTSVERILWR